jgi:hypothetical protein
MKGNRLPAQAQDLEITMGVAWKGRLSRSIVAAESQAKPNNEFRKPPKEPLEWIWLLGGFSVPALSVQRGRIARRFAQSGE